LSEEEAAPKVKELRGRTLGHKKQSNVLRQHES
jgi:hypothetical protein